MDKTTEFLTGDLLGYIVYLNLSRLITQKDAKGNNGSATIVDTVHECCLAVTK
ncbi:MAG: hypothetical protein AAGB12_04990 [Pseudomonadota bacterium]